jgi:hypothetical protein
MPGARERVPKRGGRGFIRIDDEDVRHGAAS